MRGQYNHLAVHLRDQMAEDAYLKEQLEANEIWIAMKSKIHIDELEQILRTIIRSRRIFLEKVFPYSQTGRIQTIRRYGQLLEEEYRDDGVAVKAYVPAELFAGLYSDGKG